MQAYGIELLLHRRAANRNVACQGEAASKTIAPLVVRTFDGSAMAELAIRLLPWRSRKEKARSSRLRHGLLARMLFCLAISASSLR